MDQHVDDLTSEAQQEAFRKYGVTVAQWLADVLFAGKWLDPPYPRTTISELSMDSINEKPKPQLSRPEITGDKYFKASAYDPVIANNLPELGNFSGPIPDR